VSFLVTIFSNIIQILKKDCLYESTFKMRWPVGGGMTRKKQVEKAVSDKHTRTSVFSRYIRT